MSGLTSTARMLRVEVVYALPDRQILLTLDVEQGTTARMAVERSGILQRHPEVDLERTKLGVFGRAVSPGTSLRDGDRVEIYRPLIANPRQARRERAHRGQRRQLRG